MSADLFDNLCDILEAELTRQQHIAEIVRQQRDALVARDVDALQAHTAKLETLVKESVAAQGERHRVLRSIVDAYEIPEDRQTMSALVYIAPHPQADRLSVLQDQLQSTMNACHDTVYENARIVRRSSRIVQDTLDAFSGAAPAANGAYAANGYSASSGAEPAVVNQRG